MIQRNCVIFTAAVFLFLVVFSIPSLIASQENSNKPSFKSSIPQSTIQNLSSTSFGDPKLYKAEFAQKTKKLQIPFIDNNGQVDKQVKYYANTFGGTVFVTKDGEIVYSLPNNSSDVETQCLASSMHSPKGIRDEVGMLHDYHVSDIMHPASWIVDHDKSEFQNPKSTSSDSKNLKSSNPKSAIQNLKSGVAIKETLVGGRVHEITGNEKAATKINYFKGKDPEKWKTDISTFDAVSLGEVYDGIELKLKAYGNNVEKLFCVKPGADPSQIKVRLSGVNPSKFPLNKGGQRGLSVNEHGELVAETELGAVKFTKPVAYQEINGKRVEIECGYVIADCRMKQEAGSKKVEARGKKYAILNPKSAIQNFEAAVLNPKSKIANRKLEYGFRVASYDKSHDLIIDPLLASTFLGGSGGDGGYSLALDTSGNVYVTGNTTSTDFPTTTDAYDTSYNNGGYDVFVSKLDGELTSLLASTYLGGGSSDYGYSLALDTSGNVYVTGETTSSDFPTTSGAYDTSRNGGGEDVFVSKLNSGLTNLLASTYLGGSSDDIGYSLTLDTSEHVYVTGNTFSTDFPTTSGVYDTSPSSTDLSSADAFVSKLDAELTSLLASTYLGGSRGETGYGIIIETGGNVYAVGFTGSSDFPTTSGTYDTSNGDNTTDVFVCTLDSGLTSLIASTFLGGSGSDMGYSLTHDTSGNVYVTGRTWSSDFPTTSGTYDTSYNSGNGAVFVSKLNGGLTSLLASTYLGGSARGNGIIIDTSGNVYVTGYTESTDFPTTSGAYDTSFEGRRNAFISKFNNDFTSLLASTFLGGTGTDYGYGITLDTSGNVYVTGGAGSSNFPTTIGAYDTSLGASDAFASKLDGNLSGSKPTVTTGNATSVLLTSANLNGTVNANGKSTTVWFQYDTASGSYTNTSSTTSSTQTVTGTSDTTVSIDISGLSPATTYYYRIAAQSSVGTAYGNETSFATLSDTAAPTSSLVINGNAAYTNSPNVILSLSSTDSVGITAYYLSTSDSTPSAIDTGWIPVTSTNSYSSNISYTFNSEDGNQTVYVWYKDSSGNISNSANDSIVLDTTPPTITITSPTSDDTYTTTSSVIAIGGSASDSTSGISSVTWSNNKGGNGTASGTTSWLTSSVSLILGENIITVTATDVAGNIGTDTITVTFSTSTVFTPTPTLTPVSSPTPILTPTTEPSEKGTISGYVMDKRGNLVESAKIRLKKANSRVLKKTFSDEDGFFEFTNLDADTYIITALKSGYKMVKQTITLEEGEDKDVEIVIKKTGRRMSILFINKDILR